MTLKAPTRSVSRGGAARLLLVDHRDSFTWNLVHLFREAGACVETLDHAAVGPEALAGVDALLLGPGPHAPQDYPASLALLRAAAARRLPTLGICLGLQLLGVSLGGRVRRASRVAHGVLCEVRHGGGGLFRGVSRPARFVRYHSLALEEPLPAELRLLARDGEGDVAAAVHRALPLWGVQFHPESVLSEEGSRLARNFLAGLGPGRRR